MPYTPPGPQSPATSRTSTPSISRSSSYAEDLPRSSSAARPAPPRSHGSASYLHKHRRTPSINRNDNGVPPPSPTAESDVTRQRVPVSDFVASGSVRQSPPPLNNLAMPTGAVLSPPESPDGSDVETPPMEKTNWAALEQAVRAIDQRREGSPERPATTGPTTAAAAAAASSAAPTTTTSEPVSQVTSPTALMNLNPRRSGHSRASSETSFLIASRPSPYSPSPNATTDDSDEFEDEEDGPMAKPSLVRKKSGELVKPALRASSRRRYSSMPGTPTYSKSVHFNDNDNQTRHFLQVDKPIAVSAGSSPVETYDSESEFPFEESDAPQPVRDIRLANFPNNDSFERRSAPVRVERIFLSQDRQTLIGVVAVHNLEFYKFVAARFTLDYWKTTSEVVAEYNNDPSVSHADGCDRFNFHIKLSDQANIDNKTLLLCVRYQVGGHEFWDNNGSANYQIDFTTPSPPRRPTKSATTSSTSSSSSSSGAAAGSAASSGLGQRPLNAIPRSRHSPVPGSSPSARGRRRESLDDDFAAARYDPDYNYGSTDRLMGESPNSIKLKPRSKPGSLFATSNTSPQQANGLGGRYDFGASLSAALSSAQDKLGRQSGLMGNNVRSSSSKNDGYFGPVERREGPTKANERPDDLSTDRPAMGSDQYRDLVQKFCYFTPTGSTSTTGKPSSASANASPASPAITATAVNTDGAADDSGSSSAHSSGSNTPRYDNMPSPADWASFVTRAGSPGAAAARDVAPHNFGYPYLHGAHEQFAQTAIHG